MCWSWKTSTAYSSMPAWIAATSSADSGLRMSIPSTSAAKHGPTCRILMVMGDPLLARLNPILDPSQGRWSATWPQVPGTMRLVRRPREAPVRKLPLFSAALLVVSCIGLIPLGLGAQQPAKLSRIGILWHGAAPPASPRMESLREGLREAGYVEGQNVVIELRYSTDLERLRELATELVQAHVDVIASYGDLAPRAAQRATTQVPIVAIADDFLGAGLAQSLGRPGGNTTGITIMSP